ncbi:MAG: hypothetical protein U5N85_18930 [Arcicella sp.]|nr:hypothetical protein [Arcicella sp.]
MCEINFYETSKSRKIILEGDITGLFLAVGHCRLLLSHLLWVKTPHNGTGSFLIKSHTNKGVIALPLNAVVSNLERASLRSLSL